MIEASFSAATAAVRALIDEFRRAGVAVERFEELMYLGVARSGISRRIFDEFYADARGSDAAPHRTRPFS